MTEKITFIKASKKQIQEKPTNNRDQEKLAARLKQNLSRRKTKQSTKNNHEG